VEAQLQSLITEVCSYEIGDLRRQKALNRLLILLQQLPKIYRSSHQDYPEAYNRTLEWVCKNIDSFQARSNSIVDSFVIWVNGYLKWRVRDLYLSDNYYDSKQVDLNRNNEEERDLLENIADPHFSLSLLDWEIERLQQNKQQRRGEAIINYLRQDPEHFLQEVHLRKKSECNCHFLTLRLLLNEPNERIADVARELNISNQTLYSHWKQKCLPLLQDIARRFELGRETI
jgi:hypothetical protein